MNQSATLSIVCSPDDPLADHTDAELLQLWVDQRDEPALCELIDRYGPLVLGVCRRQCRHRQDAEDAFQSTFLLFARDAARIRCPEHLGSWLHAVAYRTAVRARSRSRRYALSLVEDPPDASDPLGQVAWRHQLRILDEELAGLPERYRRPLVLHYLEGRTCPEIADRLQTTVGAVRGRLDRAKRQLRRRLHGRGVALPAVLAALASWRPSPAAAAELAERTGSEITAGAALDPASPLPDLTLLSAKGTTMTMSGLVSLCSTGAAALFLTVLSQITPQIDAGGASPITLTAAQQPAAPAARLGAAEQDSKAPRGAAGAGAAAPPAGSSGAMPGRSAGEESGGENNGRSGGEGYGMGRYGGGEGFGMDEGGFGMGAAPPAKRFPATPAGTPAEQYIRQRLGESADLSLNGSTIRDALTQIAERHALPIVAEVEGYGARAIDLQKPVRFSAGEMPLASALRLMLRPHRLTYVIEDDLIKVVPDAEALARTGVETQVWQSLDASSAERLEDALSQPVVAEFLDAPLEDVVRYFADQLNIPMLLDTRALDQLGLTRDIPVSFVVKTIPAASALELILDEYDLTYTLRGNVVSITTREAAGANQLVRLYWLAGTGLTGRSAVELIQTVVDPDTWDVLGGPSTVAVVEPRAGRRTGLAVLTTYTTHRKIAGLLDSLRGTEPQRSSEAEAIPDAPGAGKPKERATEGAEGPERSNRNLGNEPFGPAADPFGNPAAAAPFGNPAAAAPFGRPAAADPFGG